MKEIEKGFFLSLFVYLTISGCDNSIEEFTPVHLGVYSHPNRGEVTEKDKIFLIAREGCRQKTFNEPVYVDDRKLIDHDELLEVLSTYYSSENKKMKVPPEYVAKINAMQNKFVDCIVNKEKYKLVRVDLIDPLTGEVINSMDMSDARHTN